MTSDINKFIIHLFIFSALLGIITFGLSYILPATYFSPVLPLLFPFFFSVIVIVFSYLLKSREKKFNQFVNRFMLCTFIKLMIYLAVLLAYVFTHKEDAVPFILSFFILYVAYTVFEVIKMLQINKQVKKE
jgi:uncharacterized membrane protein YoaK (UPF0700 family)